MLRNLGEADETKIRQSPKTIRHAGAGEIRGLEAEVFDDACSESVCRSRHEQRAAFAQLCAQHFSGVKTQSVPHNLRATFCANTVYLLNKFCRSASLPKWSPHPVRLPCLRVNLF